MNPRTRPVRRRLRGSALLAVLVFSLIIATAVSALMSLGIERRRDAVRLDLYNAQLAVAERAVDSMASQIFFLGVNRPAPVAQSANGLSTFVTSRLQTHPPNFPGYSLTCKIDPMISDVDSTGKQTPTEITDAIVDSTGIQDLASWKGYKLPLATYRVMVGVRTLPASGLTGSNVFAMTPTYLSKNVSFYLVPLLNYAIFYDPPMEINAGVRLDVKGKVHTNGNWYLTSGNNAGVYYHDSCTVAGDFCGGIYSPEESRGWNPPANPIYISKTGPATPGAAAPTASFVNLRHTPNDSSVNHGYLSAKDYHDQTPPKSANSPRDTTKWTNMADWVDHCQAMYNQQLKDRQMGVQRVKLPIGEGVNPRAVIEPANLAAQGSGGDSEALKQQKLVYKAAIIIETGDNWPRTADDFKLYRLEPDSSAPNGYKQTPTKYYSYKYKSGTSTVSFLSTSRFWNGREERFIYSVDLDMAKLATYLSPTTVNGDATKEKFTLNNPDTDSDGIIYVWPRQDKVYADSTKFIDYAPTGATAPPADASSGYDRLTQRYAGTTPDNGLPVTGAPEIFISHKNQAALRIVNAADCSGALLNSGIASTNGMSIVSDAPLYTKGYINSTNKIPLLLGGDSINLLSAAFNDATYGPLKPGTGSSADWAWDGPNATPTAPTTAGNPDAVSVSVITNAVFLGGNVPSASTRKHNATAPIGDYYSGGGENYFRYLENWGGTAHPHQFKGSILNLFESKYAKRPWDKDVSNVSDSNYYSPPQRLWSWDPSYAAGVNPPGIPSTFNSAVSRWNLMAKAEFVSAGGTVP